MDNALTYCGEYNALTYYGSPADCGEYIQAILAADGEITSIVDLGNIDGRVTIYFNHAYHQMRHLYDGGHVEVSASERCQRYRGHLACLLRA